MKLILQLSIWLMPLSGVAEITYEPIFVDQCLEKERQAPLWYLKGSLNLYGLDIFGSEYVILPGPGTYWMYFEFDDDPIEIIVPNVKYFKDTIRLPRLELVHYVSNPPHSEFLDCGSLAEGEVVDYYNNGDIRKKGTFNRGQPIDTLFSYYQNGVLSEMFIPNKTGWQRTRYFENGNIKSYFNLAERVEMEYFTSGKLKREEHWDSKYNETVQEFTENGELILNQTKKKQERFSDQGKLISVISRKEVLILDRIFLRKKWDRFYEFTWKTFDSNELIKRQIIFSEGSFNGEAFPKSHADIPAHLIDEVIFYQNGKANQKIHFHTKKEGDQYIKYMVLSRMMNDDWSIGTEMKFDPDKLHELIGTLSKQE